MSEEWEDDDVDNPKTSKYHAAFDQLKRINELWKRIHDAFVEVNYPKVNEHLDCIWMEFEDDIDKEDSKNNPDDWIDLHKVMNNINKRLIACQLYSLNSSLKIHNPKLYSKLLSMQKQALMDKQIFLRALQNKAGKGTAYKDSLDEYIDI